MQNKGITLNSRLLLVKLSVIQSFSRSLFCLLSKWPGNHSLYCFLYLFYRLLNCSLATTTRNDNSQKTNTYSQISRLVIVHPTFHTARTIQTVTVLFDKTSNNYSPGQKVLGHLPFFTWFCMEFAANLQCILINMALTRFSPTHFTKIPPLNKVEVHKVYKICKGCLTCNNSNTVQGGRGVNLNNIFIT